jgi:hypothetical protein
MIAGPGVIAGGYAWPRAPARGAGLNFNLKLLNLKAGRGVAERCKQTECAALC